ncbi:MAG TPA: hypothetical protein VHG72_23195 [Polyangia bacterium]|nr:hypothetical protein [Polyangia bacterium]
MGIGGRMAVAQPAPAPAGQPVQTSNPGDAPATDAAAAAAAEAAAREAADAAAREQQKRDLADLRAEVNALRAQIDADQKARATAEAALAAHVQAVETQANQAPPQVLTARLGVSLTGYLQADWTAYNQLSQDQLSPTGVPLNQSEFFIRRARLRAAIDRWWVAGLLEFDGNTVNGAAARIIGAEASLKWPAERGGLPILMATIGMFKIPFGFEVGQSDRERLFLERSTAEHGLFPGEYDAGARLMGGWRFVRYSFAVMDGEPVGEKGGFPLHDPNSAKDYVGRLGVETPIVSTVWVAGGFSGLSGKGFHPGTAATKPTIQWVDRDGNGVLSGINELVLIPGAAAIPSQNFSRFGYGADLRIGVDEPGLGSTVLGGEVYWAKNLDRGILPADPIAFGRDYRELGFYAGLTQDLGPHAQAGIRYDFYNPDADSINTIMGAMRPTALSYQTVAFAAALRAPSGRLIAEFDLNRNHNGRDAEGNPANLASNAFTLRGEVSF